MGKISGLDCSLGSCVKKLVDKSFYFVYGNMSLTVYPEYKEFWWQNSQI